MKQPAGSHAAVLQGGHQHERPGKMPGAAHARHPPEGPAETTGAVMTLSIESLKDQARRLRASLADSGEPISHSRSLELVARQHGYRDWNTVHAAIGNRPAVPPVTLGGKASGRYLNQPFTARVIGVEARLEPGRWKVTLQLDEPVDVVTFDSFSAFRSRITATVDADGRTAEKTSNGLPHLVLDL